MRTHAISCFSFLELSKWRIFGHLRYRGYFFSDFYKSIFFIFTYGQIRKLGLQKIEIFKHPSFRYSPIDFQTYIFSIFAYSRIRKLGSQKSEIFKHPSFRYSLIAKYENLEHKNPRFLNVQWNLHLAPHFDVGRLGRIWLQANIEKMNVCKSRVFKI